MQKYEELQFVTRLGLQKLKTFGEGYMARCPICGDSKKKAHITRFYILNKRMTDKLYVFCHNCGYNNSFKWFLYEYYKDIFKEYVRLELQSALQNAASGTLISQCKRKEVLTDKNEHKLRWSFNYNPRYFIPAETNAKCVAFCKKRNIPIEGLFYCNKPNKVYNGMLIFPFWIGNKWYGFQARSLDRKFFHTFSPNKQYKVWNIFNLDRTKPVVICEAIIDAMSVDNAIAMLGSDINDKILKELEGLEVIFAFDNDKTGLNKSKKYAAAGETVFMWPKEMPAKIKDFNDLAKKGVTKEGITNMIYKNKLKNLIANVVIGLTNAFSKGK